MHYVLLTLLFIISVSQAAYADCYLRSTDNTRKEGTIVFNRDYDVLQVCASGRWRAMGRILPNDHQPCAEIKTPGCLHTDGTVYVGLTPDGDRPMYTTRCAAGFTWGGYSCTGTLITLPWNNGNASGMVAPNVSHPWKGAENTATLVATDANSGADGFQEFLAAHYCNNLGLHGHADWYLPARMELAILYESKVDIRGFVQGRYLSSTSNGATNPVIIAFSSGTASNEVAWGARHVRCVRRDE